MTQHQPVALIILDGWGIREMAADNAVVAAETPNYDRWLRTRERCILDASGTAVGLPAGQMGNSEVGHLNLGAGRVVYQDLTRIDKACESGSFNGLAPLDEVLAAAAAGAGRVHLIGLLGTGGVHSHDRHRHALLDTIARDCPALSVIVHVITDGRDTPPRSAREALAALEARLAQMPRAVVASVSGRYYAMDRDRRWERTARAYRAIAQHESPERAANAMMAVDAAYTADITDEFIPPTIIETGAIDGRLLPGDWVICTNFRADRMRQMTRALSDATFDAFDRGAWPAPSVATMTAYEADLPVVVLFGDEPLPNPLADVLSRAGLTQFHAAETEKYAHVTYFFNGGIETPVRGEERHLEPSPKVATYDLQPEMSAAPLMEAVLARLAGHDDAFILVNFANPDMVGHTGDLAAATRAVATVDACAGRLVEAIVAKGGVALVTADHGNAEIMRDGLTGKPHTYHTTNPVSLFVIGSGYWSLVPRGKLADVAPTILALLDVPTPAEMTGQNLIVGHQ